MGNVGGTGKWAFFSSPKEILTQGLKPAEKLVFYLRKRSYKNKNKFICILDSTKKTKKGLKSKSHPKV